MPQQSLTDERMDVIRRIEHHTRTLDRNIRLTQMADAKAAPVLALQATLAAVTVTQSDTLAGLFDTTESTMWHIAAILLLGVYILSAVTSAGLATWVYLPRAPHPGLRTHHGTSIIYFDDIQAMARDEFESRSTAIDEEALELDVLRQAYTVAGIAAEKMHHVQNAFFSTGATLSAWIVLLLWARAAT